VDQQGRRGDLRRRADRVEGEPLGPGQNGEAVAPLRDAATFGIEDVPDHARRVIGADHRLVVDLAGLLVPVPGRLTTGALLGDAVRSAIAVLHDLAVLEARRHQGQRCDPGVGGAEAAEVEGQRS
jgi:hypothetical protein